MAFTPPDSVDLKARYPAFAGVDADVIDAALEDAALDVGENWIPAHRGAALMALAAHRLFSEGALAGDDAKDAGAVTAAVTEMRSGDTAIRFAQPGDAEVVERTGFARTPYGRRFLELRARSFPAVLVI